MQFTRRSQNMSQIPCKARDNQPKIPATQSPLGGLGGIAQGGLGALTGQGGLGGLTQGGLGGLVSQFTSGLQSGSPLAAAIEGGLVGTLGSRFGLGPAATGAIAAALPGLLQRMTAHR